MLSTIVALTSKLFKPFLQSRERDDLTVVFVIHYLINCYDNPAKNHCSERDPPRPRSEHKFYGISLLINLYTTICIYRGLSRDVPVFARILFVLFGNVFTMEDYLKERDEYGVFYLTMSSRYFDIPNLCIAYMALDETGEYSFNYVMLSEAGD